MKHNTGIMQHTTNKSWQNYLCIWHIFAYISTFEIQGHSRFVNAI